MSQHPSSSGSSSNGISDSSSSSPITLSQQILLTLSLLTLSSLLLFLQVLSASVKRIRKSNRRRRRLLFKRLGLEPESFRDGNERRYTVVGFFHPYCNAGGGGERVLFEAMRYHLESDQATICVVYSGDVAAAESLTGSRPTAFAQGASSVADGGGMATKEEILAKARDRFDIDLLSFQSRIAILPLSSRRMVSDNYWRRLTMLGQSFGSAVLAKEACTELIPDVFLDTMGYAFAYPIWRVFKLDVPIGAYVHYPMISTDMLERVRGRSAGHTNDAAVAKSAVRSYLKLVYYRVFATLYAWSLRRANVVVANGSWTQNHINRYLLRGRGDEVSNRKRSSRRAEIVYPPCDTRSLESFPLQGRDEGVIVSLAQFRPEKEHRTQIKFLRALLDKRPELAQQTRLVMMGSCRNQGDEERIEGLKRLVKELNVDSNVEFIVNAPYSTILTQLSRASVGLSTMVDEHFGINVVEFMAAGLIPLSHASAGPLLDIAVPVGDLPTGLHASDVTSFAEAYSRIIDMDAETRLAMRTRARRRAKETFSAEAFRSTWEARLWSRLVDGGGGGGGGGSGSGKCE